MWGSSEQTFEITWASYKEIGDNVNSIQLLLLSLTLQWYLAWMHKRLLLPIAYLLLTIQSCSHPLHHLKKEPDTESSPHLQYWKRNEVVRYDLPLNTHSRGGRKKGRGGEERRGRGRRWVSRYLMGSKVQPWSHLQRLPTYCKTADRLYPWTECSCQRTTSRSSLQKNRWPNTWQSYEFEILLVGGLCCELGGR